MVICGVYKPSGPDMKIKVDRVDGSKSRHVHGRYSPQSPESNCSEEDYSSEVDDKSCEKAQESNCSEEDYSSEVDDKSCEKAQESNKYRLWKPQPGGPSKSRSFSKQLDSIHVPQSSQCLTVQTYDRPFIQAWLDALPKTQQVLLLEALFSNPKRTANEKGSEGITPQDHPYMSQLVGKLSREFQLQQREAAQLQKTESAQLQQREAAQEIRALTKDTQMIGALTKGKQLYRAHLNQEEVISALISWLSSTDSETQEHAVTALYNLSILDANKKLIVEKGAVQPMLDVLKNGSMPARENAAAALSNLSEVFDNKIVIGKYGAIPALVQLLREGKIDAGWALLRLCTYQGNRTECLHKGVVPVLLKLMKNEEGEDRSIVACVLAILVLIAGNEEHGSAIREAIKFNPDHNKEDALVLLFVLLSRDSAYTKEVENSEEVDGYVAVLDLSTSRIDRAKRRALLERI